MEHKRLAVRLKEDSAGAFRAVFATFNEVDHDGDVTLSGAFPVGAKIPIAGVGHNWDVPTIGVGTIGADAEKAWVDGLFNLKMLSARETYESVKFDEEQGAHRQEYSYAYDVAKGHSARPDEQKQWPGAKRVLESLIPHEISPVLLGAGLDTGTAWIKGRRRKGAPLSDEDKRTAIRTAIADAAMSAEGGLDPYSYIVATYPDRVIVCEDDGSYREIAYAIDAGGVVTLGDETEVVQTWSPKSLDLASRAARVLTDTSALATHARAAVAMRAKESRPFPPANRERIGQQIEALKASAAALEAMLRAAPAGTSLADPAVLRSMHRANVARLAREFDIPQLCA